MKLIDIGINLTNRLFDADREQVFQDAEAAGVSPLIITGTSEHGSFEAMQYAAKYPGKLYTTAGVHPHNAKNCDKGTIDKLREIAANDCVVAIGECGLDYNRDFSPRDMQREWFTKQLQLAQENSMPVFLHEREAFHDFVSILKEHRTGLKSAVVHCFTGTEKELETYLDLGFYIGITGWICDERRGKHLEGLVRMIPADKLMIETDAPYLIPRDMKNRQSRNEPKNLVHIAEVIARHLDKDIEILARETYENTCRFFGIK